MSKKRTRANGKSMSPTIIGPYSNLTTAFPTNRLYEVHDSLVLALDATEGSVGLKGLNDSRSYVSAALANINFHLPALQTKDRAGKQSERGL